MEDNIILVMYVGCALVDDNDVVKFTKEVSTKLKLQEFIPNAKVIVIPTNEINTRIECINPKYITEDELIRKHRLLLDELHEKINEQLNKFNNG